MCTIWVYKHYTFHLLIIKISHEILWTYFLSIISIFPLNFFILEINFIKIIILINDKGRRWFTYKETFMFNDIRSILTIIFTDLSIEKWKWNQLSVNRYVKFVFFLIKVIIRKEIILNLSLNRYFIQWKYKNIRLEDKILVFRYSLYL